MANLLTFAFVLFAQNEVPQRNGGGPDFTLPILLICGVFIMFFVMSLPQKRERKRWNDMVEALKKNDRVLMSSGIIGKVHLVQKDKNEIVIKIDDDTNTKMTFSLGAVSRILEQQNKESSDAK
ncbi:MAG: preprotein translocase subunit YajC [Planctomycetaceae bacterium]|nr:preprotein translocase subunit YajC [Planctomycetaceae bacterium]